MSAASSIAPDPLAERIAQLRSQVGDQGGGHGGGPMIAAALALAVIAGTPTEPKPELAWPGKPYVAHTLQVADHPMRYVESGRGDPISMLHGVPTQGYLRRDVVDGSRPREGDRPGPHGLGRS